jgi:hypothetical protein
VRQQFTKEFDSQVGGLLHEAEFFTILNKAQIPDQGLGQRLKESAMARHGFAAKRQLGDRGRFGVKGAVLDPTGGKPPASLLASGLGGDQNASGACLLPRLRRVPAVREHSGAMRGYPEDCVGAGEPAEVADVGQMGDEQALNAVLLHLAAERAEPA